MGYEANQKVLRRKNRNGEERLTMLSPSTRVRMTLTVHRNTNGSR